VEDGEEETDREDEDVATMNGTGNSKVFTPSFVLPIRSACTS